jgi:hypothetical protein
MAGLTIGTVVTSTKRDQCRWQDLQNSNDPPQTWTTAVSSLLEVVGLLERGTRHLARRRLDATIHDSVVYQV